MAAETWESWTRAGRHVVVRNACSTQMLVDSDKQAQAFAKQLIRLHKPFDASPRDEDDKWTFIVYEQNEPSRWEYA